MCLITLYSFTTMEYDTNDITTTPKCIVDTFKTPKDMDKYTHVFSQTRSFSEKERKWIMNNRRKVINKMHARKSRKRHRNRIDKLEKLYLELLSRNLELEQELEQERQTNRNMNRCLHLLQIEKQ